jgi:hypothetical protein
MKPHGRFAELVFPLRLKRETFEALRRLAAAEGISVLFCLQTIIADKLVTVERNARSPRNE